MSRRHRPRVWWMCLNPYADTPPRTQHLAYEDARTEALRLSLQERRKIHVVQLVGTAHPPTDLPMWEERAQ